MGRKPNRPSVPPARAISGKGSPSPCGPWMPPSSPAHCKSLSSNMLCAGLAPSGLDVFFLKKKVYVRGCGAWAAQLAFKLHWHLFPHCANFPPFHFTGFGSRSLKSWGNNGALYSPLCLTALLPTSSSKSPRSADIFWKFTRIFRGKNAA